MSLKMTYFLQSSALVSPHFFFLNIKLLFWGIDGATPGVAPSMWHSQSDFGEMTEVIWASKGRDALKPNFNKWPEEPFLPSRNGSSGHLLKFGFKVSRPLLAKWRKLRHLCPKKGQLWCLSWWFCLLSGTTLAFKGPRWRNSFLNSPKNDSGVWVGFKGHRWRNSFYTIQIRAISPYIQAKMIGNVVNLVNNTLISIYWSGSCAIYLFILK